MSSEIKCINDHDDFCFVCGTRVFHIKKKGEIPKMRYIDGPKFVEGYQQLFNRNPLDRIVDWSPRISCDTCFTKMTHPTRLQNIESPMEWFAPVDHPNDCFFCQTVVPPGTNKRRAGSIQYADVPAVKKPKFTHEEADDYFDDDGDFNIDAIVEDIVEDIVGDSSVAVPPAENEPSDETVNVAEGGEFNIRASTASHASSAAFNIRASTSSYASSSGSEFTLPKHYSNLQPRKEKESIVLTQQRMNDLIRDLNLSKLKAEILASRLNDLGLGGGK